MIGLRHILVRPSWHLLQKRDTNLNHFLHHFKFNIANYNMSSKTMIQLIFNVLGKPETEYFNIFLIFSCTWSQAMSIHISFPQRDVHTNTHTQIAHRDVGVSRKRGSLLSLSSNFPLMSSCLPSHWGFADIHKTTRATFLCVLVSEIEKERDKSVS